MAKFDRLKILMEKWPETSLELLKCVDTRSSKILELRTGFKHKRGKCLTQAEVGKKFKISSVRVCAIETKALGILQKKINSRLEFIHLKEDLKVIAYEARDPNSFPTPRV